MKFLFVSLVIVMVFISSQACKSPSEVSQNEEGMIKADVGEGKVIYMRDCTRCHEQKKVEDFTSAQWANILPRMVVQAQLDDTESRQVKAYIEWELENE